MLLTRLYHAGKSAGFFHALQVQEMSRKGPQIAATLSRAGIDINNPQQLGRYLVQQSRQNRPEGPTLNQRFLQSLIGSAPQLGPVKPESPRPSPYSV